MKSVFALAAFVVFGFNAATMSSDGWGDLTPLYEAIRPAFIGLALLSLAFVEWGRLARALDEAYSGVAGATPGSAAPPAAAPASESED